MNSNATSLSAHIDAVDTPESIRAAALGDRLTQAIDAYVSEPNGDTLRNWNAALVERCASMAASAVLGTHLRIDEQGEEIAELKRQIAARS